MIWNHCGLMQLRNPLDFMMWNHVFIAYESYRAFGVDYVLCVLGAVCTILSLLRHRFRETRFNTSEPLVAKATQVYIALAATSFPAEQIIGVVCVKAAMLLLWSHEDSAFLGGYERAHPWLHILAALDAHYYISCCAEMGACVAAPRWAHVSLRRDGRMSRCARQSRIIPVSFT